MRCLGATGQLGYGMPPEAFWAGIAAEPDAIGADMGSTDPGPYYLGSGALAAARPSRMSDLAMLVEGSRRAGVPAVIGTAGTAGGAPHLNTTLADLQSVVREMETRIRATVIAAEIDRSVLHRKLDENRVKPCGPAPPLTHDEVERSVRLVGQMGVEPIMDALAGGAEVVLAGRCCDTAVFASAAIAAGCDRGVATHQAKILECASQCADPGGRDAIMSEIEDKAFVVESLNPRRRCTPQSVAAHSLYEQLDPYVVSEPGGRLDLSSCTFEQATESATRVSGSRWIDESEYWVKIEGAARVGHRCFSMGGIRDPTAIRELDATVAGVRTQVGNTLPRGAGVDDFRLRFLVYGRDGVLGENENVDLPRASEVMVLIDVIAPTAEEAHSICGTAKQLLLHFFYDGILATGGNMAIPFGPDVHDGGEVYRFNVYHLVRLDDPLEVFPSRTVVLG